jgi:homocysteine S-methyltransferase
MAARDELCGERREAGERPRPLVAASVGPYGAFLADGSEYRGDYGLDVEALVEFHRRRLEVLAASGADQLAVETVPSYPEAVALGELLGASAGLPAWVAFSCRDGRTLWDGTPLRRAVAAVASVPRVLAVGVNCTAPELITSLLREAAAVTDKPLVAYPNSGESYDAAARSWRPAARSIDWREACLEWHRAGARLIGGCCRTGPADVAALRSALVG